MPEGSLDFCNLLVHRLPLLAQFGGKLFALRRKKTGGQPPFLLQFVGQITVAFGQFYQYGQVSRFDRLAVVVP